MVGGDQLSFTDAIGGARLVMIPLPVYKRQPSNFARRPAEIPVPAAVAVNAAAQPVRPRRCPPPLRLVAGHVGRPADTLRRLWLPT